MRKLTKTQAHTAASSAEPAERQPSTKPSAARETSPSRWRSEGQRLLAERPESGAELARMLGTTRASVSAWRLGNKRPSPEAQRTIERELGIPARAWRDLPSSTKATPTKTAPPRSSTKAAPPSPGGEGEGEIEILRRPRIPLSDGARTNLARIEELLEEVDEARKQGPLLPTELAKLSSEARQLIIARERLLTTSYEQAELEWIEAAFVAESPAWPRLRRAILEALRPHREAMEAVVRALEELAAEGHPLCQEGA